MIATVYSLQCRSLSQIIDEFRKLRRNAGVASGRDCVALRTRMAQFQSLRPWFPRGYRCLFDSLAAARYLAGFGLTPALVFGVQGEPFEAHCWLQQGDVVVNDTVDVVAPFASILVV